MYVTVDCPEQDYVGFEIPVFIAKKYLINAMGLEHSYCIIENLSFGRVSSIMKEVVDGILYHTTQVAYIGYHVYDI